MKLSDKTQRKFIESYDIDEWEIESDSGWVDISKIHKTIEYTKYTLKTESGLVIECADTHILFDSNMNEIYAVDCLNVDIITKLGTDKVLSVENTSEKEHMYDLEIDSDDHRFFTNDILSHNSTTITIDILHYILFNEHKTTVILANKAATAREIFSRVQLAYEHLPKWLQQGVIEWNKGSCKLENGSRCICAASSGSAIRGMSVDYLFVDECITGDSLVTVEDKETGEIKQIQIEELYHELA